MSDWDVIVVGAGPGGTTAARGLAKAGLRVLLLEKEKTPRYKPCGGGLTAKVRDVLDVDFSPALEDTITQVSVAYRAERLRVNPVTAWCVMRDRFDLLLAQHAASAGAEYRDASPVSKIEFDTGGARVTARGESLRTRFVVGADGVNRIVRKAAGFPAHKRMAVAIEAEWSTSSAGLEEWRNTFHLDYGAIPWGYGWIFPKAEHLSVGVGVVLKPAHLDLRAELGRYVSSEPSLKDGKEILVRGHRVPLGGTYAKYHAPYTVLIGDAAGVVDPFTAEGIYYAILSGKMIAAEEIANAFQRGDLDTSRYTWRINKEINSDFRWAWLATQLFYRAPRFMYRTFRKSVNAQRAAIDIVGGPGSYRRTLLRLVSKLPRMAMDVRKLWKK
jgi:geranylgeranyl reductase family protein